MKTKKCFFVKTCVETSKVIMNSLKTIDFVTKIPLTPSLDNSIFIFGLQLKILSRKQTKKEQKCEVKKMWGLGVNVANMEVVDENDCGHDLDFFE